MRKSCSFVHSRTTIVFGIVVPRPRLKKVSQHQGPSPVTARVTTSRLKSQRIIQPGLLRSFTFILRRPSRRCLREGKRDVESACGKVFPRPTFQSEPYVPRPVTRALDDRLDTILLCSSGVVAILGERTSDPVHVTRALRP